MKLSLIIPLYKSEMNVYNAYYEIRRILLDRENGFETELIFVNDGSPDKSIDIVKEIYEKDNRVKYISFSRNFGMHAAILAGMEVASGDCISSISCDLQDPLELLIEMFRKWQEGNKVVLANRQERDDPFFTKLFANIYYKLLRKNGLKSMPDGGFDFYLIDKQVKDDLIKMKEKNSDIHCQIVWLGYKPYIFKYKRKNRKAGKSSWTFKKKVKLFIDSFVSFSYAPINLVTSLGFLMSILGLVFAVKVLIDRLLSNIDVEGWSSLIIVILIIGGVQLIMLGIIGEYLWRNFDETRKRPNYVIDEKRGFDDDRF